jgi:hypothetical protein
MAIKKAVVNCLASSSPPGRLAAEAVRAMMKRYSSWLLVAPRWVYHLLRKRLTSTQRLGAFTVKTMDPKGRGLFARGTYEPGILILPITGPRVAGRGEYTIQLDATTHIESEAPLRFANHSCTPNMGIKTDSEGRPGFYALRHIQRGEELTWDYAMSEFDFDCDGSPQSFPCSCGTHNCRGLIERGWQGLSPELKRRYREWVMPYLRAGED